MAEAPALATSPLVEAMKAPISEANPVGDDATYDDTFQQIKNEIDQATSVGGGINHEKMLEGGDGSVATGGGGVDYGEIVRNSRELLETKTKDLRLGGYLALGLFYTQGIAGLAEGLAAMDALAETYWEDMYPPLRRARARKSAVELIVGRVGDALADYKPTLEERDALDQALAALSKLQGFLTEKLEENAPAMSGLKRAVEEVQRRAPKPAPPPPPKPEVQAQAKPAAPPAKATVQAAATAPPAAPQNKGEANRVLMDLADFLFSQEQTDPTPYRLHRLLRWGGLEQAPPGENGRTLIGDPPEARRQALAGMLERGDHAMLIREAESAFTEPPFHFWLDLQRLIASAMEGMGMPFQAARDAVLVETALLVQRVPGLLKLTFSDGTPFADAFTQEWIEARVRPLLSSGGGAGAAPAAGADDALEEQFKEARQQLSTGDLAGALQAMEAGAAQDRSGQARFRRRLYLAMLCLRGGQPAIARPILESLDEAIVQHGVDVWEPALAQQVWASLYKSYEALASGPATPETQQIRLQASAVFEKICRLDAGFAFTLFGKETS